MISKYLLSVFTFVVFNLGATALAQEVLFPASIQDSIDRGECTMPELVGSAPPAFFGPPLMQQYRLTFNDTGTFFLYQYSLGRDSDFQGVSESTPDGRISTLSRFSGAVWLLAQESYSLSGEETLPHRMTLYTEQVAGEREFEAASSLVGEIRLRLSSEALLFGNGSFRATLDDYSEEESLSSDGPVTCLAEGCGIGASFNLVNINYVQTGDQAVTGIISSLGNVQDQFLYSQESFFPGLDETPSLFFEDESRLFVGSPVLLGDCDLNGNVDFLDLAPFIEVLSSGNYLPEADCNEDNAVDFLDLGPFIAILSGNEA